MLHCCYLILSSSFSGSDNISLYLLFFFLFFFLLYLCWFSVLCSWLPFRPWLLWAQLRPPLLDARWVTTATCCLLGCCSGGTLLLLFFLFSAASFSAGCLLHAPLLAVCRSKQAQRTRPCCPICAPLVTSSPIAGWGQLLWLLVAATFALCSLQPPSSVI